MLYPLVYTTQGVSYGIVGESLDPFRQPHTHSFIGPRFDDADGMDQSEADVELLGWED